MKLFDVYPVFDIEIEKAQGSYVYDKKGVQYLDFYGGHAVISIGHSHPTFVNKLKEQLDKVSFYSNSIRIEQQKELAHKLGELSGLTNHQLFLVSSGAEANENALKLASFHTNKKKVISFNGAFHGRTSGTVAITDNPKIIAPYNDDHQRVILPFDLNKVEEELKKEDVAAVIIEGIQGVGGIKYPKQEFWTGLEKLTKQYGSCLILDEVQSGYGRTGEFFAYQHFGIQPDIITTAKGMGNGFPIGGVLIAPHLEPWYGMLGTTFGGNYLACAAGISVLDTIRDENLIQNAQLKGNQLMSTLTTLSSLKEIRGKGLMIGLEFDIEIKEKRRRLLMEHHLFTGVTGTHTIRLLPSLNVTDEQIEWCVNSLKAEF